MSFPLLGEELQANTIYLHSPVYGVIFLFKYPTAEQPNDRPKDGDFDYDAAEQLFFAAQTIQNACGTQALLSVLLNKEDQVDLGPRLREFKDFTEAFPAEVSSSQATRRNAKTDGGDHS